MGSPSVPAERLSASESVEAVEAMMDYCGHDKIDAMIGIEIGGSNGLQPLTLGSTRNFNVPTVDADWMGKSRIRGHLAFRTISRIQRANHMMYRSRLSEYLASHNRRPRGEQHRSMFYSLGRRKDPAHD